MPLPRTALLVALATLGGCTATVPPDPAVRTTFDDGTYRRSTEWFWRLPALSYTCPPERCPRRTTVALVNTIAPRRVCGDPDAPRSAEIVARDEVTSDSGTPGVWTIERPPTRFRSSLRPDDTLSTLRFETTVDGGSEFGTFHVGCTRTRVIIGAALAPGRAQADALADKAFTEAARQPI